MNSGQKKGINFDLDTNALKIHYTEGDWRNAYYDVRNFFKKNGFEHIQGSGYHTLMPMSEPDVMTIVYRMTKRFPWINYCVSVCTLADVPEAFDISHVFVREAERLDEAMTSTTQGIDTLSMHTIGNMRMVSAIRICSISISVILGPITISTIEIMYRKK